MSLVKRTVGNVVGCTLWVALSPLLLVLFAFLLFIEVGDSLLTWVDSD